MVILPFLNKIGDTYILYFTAEVTKFDMHVSRKKGVQDLSDFSTSHHYEYVSDHGIPKNTVSRSVFALVF